MAPINIVNTLSILAPRKGASGGGGRGGGARGGGHDGPGGQPIGAIVGYVILGCICLFLLIGLLVIAWDHYNPSPMESEIEAKAAAMERGLVDKERASEGAQATETAEA